MDMSDFRSYYTLVLFVIFIGIWAWAWSRKSKNRFHTAANSLFDEKEEKIHAASLNDERMSGEKS